MITPLRAVLALALVRIAFASTGACEKEEFVFQQAITYAQMERRAEARELLLGCAEAHPRAKRYQIELAGLAYLEKDLSTARRYLHAALALDRSDAYVNEFLGTLFFMERNLPAALLYWNATGKPRIGSFAVPDWFPPELLSLPPGGQLLLKDLRTAEARSAALRLGPLHADLAARADGAYDVALNIPSHSGRAVLARSLRGLAFQSLTPEWRNINNSGVSWAGLFRWDAQKRRMDNSLTAPLFGSTKWRLELGADFRRETWNVGVPHDFRLHSAVTRAAIGAVESGRWEWSTGFSASTRSISNAGGLSSGRAMESQTRARVVLVDRPQSQLFVFGEGSVEIGRFYTEKGGAYGRVRGDLTARWQPRPARVDMVAIRASIGSIAGPVPFDRQFFLGIERDTDLWLRGHFATRGGKKGSGLISREYALWNTQYEVEVFRLPLMTVSAGPFFDTGRVPGLPWQYDAGAQVRVSLAGGVSLVLSWGRDLRTGRHSWYLSNGLFGSPPGGR